MHGTADITLVGLWYIGDFFHMFRFCYACVAGFQPTNTSCSLCAQKGGAFKRTATIDGQQAQNWVHCICANWIPEIDEEPDKNVKAGPKVHLEKMLKERSRLKCNKCSGRSGCVQCSHGRCTQAIHPYCMLQGDGSFTWRVVETETALGIPVYRRELYCTAHLNDVAEPMKRGEMLIQVAYGTLVILVLGYCANCSLLP